MDELNKLKAQLEAIYEAGHSRGCQGREYTCTCEYDDMVEATARGARATIEIMESFIADQRKTIDDLLEQGRDVARHMTRLVEWICEDPEARAAEYKAAAARLKPTAQ